MYLLAKTGSMREYNKMVFLNDCRRITIQNPELYFS